MLAEELHVGLDGSLLVGADVGLIVVKVNVPHSAPEQVFFARPDCWRWRRRRLGDSEASAGLLRSAGAFGDEMIGSGRTGAHRLRPAGLDRTDAVDGNISGVGRLPAQGRGLPLLNCIWAHRNGSCGRCGWWRGWWRRRRG